MQIKKLSESQHKMKCKCASKSNMVQDKVKALLKHNANKIDRKVLAT